jgi:hypothetical protein
MDWGRFETWPSQTGRDGLPHSAGAAPYAIKPSLEHAKHDIVVTSDKLAHLRCLLIAETREVARPLIAGGRRYLSEDLPDGLVEFGIHI